MKKILPLLAGAAILAMVGATGCAQKGNMAGETMYKRVPAKAHKHQFPDGHGGRNCYYDEKGDVYFCAY